MKPTSVDSGLVVADDRMRLRRYRIPLVVLLAGSLLWATGHVGRLYLGAGEGLTARYYANPSWEGSPTFTVVDAEPSTALVSTRWGNRTPSAFSVAWTGYLAVGRSGLYDFTITSDDGSRLYLDGTLIVDNSGTHSSIARAGQARLTRGAHLIRIDFEQLGAEYGFDWTWAPEGAMPSHIPTWALSQRVVGYGTAVTTHIASTIQWPAAAAAGIGAVWLLLPGINHITDALLRRLRIAARLAFPLERALAVAAFGLPAFFILHAIVFWGRGIVDVEARGFIINYLADRPFAAVIFDPMLNDWGKYQARELSYVFDFVDARLFAALLARHWLVFVPLSGVIGLIAAALIHAYGARRVLRMDVVTTGLLLALFLSCIVTQASTGVLYRSSKIVLTVSLLAFLFQLTGLVRETNDVVRTSGRRLLGLFGLALAMSMADRQGFFFLVATTAIVGALWLRDLVVLKAGWLTSRLRVILVSLAAIAAAVGYNVALAPQIILRTNGYWPDRSYQDLPLDQLTWALVMRAFEMFGTQVSYFLGHASLIVIVCLGYLVGRTLSGRGGPAAADRRLLNVLTSDTTIVTAGTLGALVVLLGLMIMRHPPIGQIADHALWYYTLPLQGVLLFGTTLILSRLSGESHREIRLAAHLVLLAMIVGNVEHYRQERQVMIDSDLWFGQQYAFTQACAREFNVIEGRDRSPRTMPSWIQLGSSGVVVEWPADSTYFLDNVKIAYATLTRRPPFVDAGGPHWEALRQFLNSAPSLWRDSVETRALMEGLRSIGVRRIVIGPGGDGQTGEVQGMMTAIAAAIGDGDATWAEGPSHTVVLADGPGRRPLGPTLRAIPPETFRVTPSAGSLRVDFDRARVIRRIRTDLTEAALADYPRQFTVASVDGARAIKTLYDAVPLGPIMRGLLEEPRSVPFEIDLEPDRERTLLLREVGHTQSWNWSLHPVTFLEAE